MEPIGVKTRILRNTEDLRRSANGLSGLAEYLPLMIRIDKYKPSRSVDQNAKFHAICSDISKQREWAGHKMGTEDWKRLLVDFYTRTEEGLATRIVPSLDGAGVVSLGEQTRKMNTSRMSGLIEFSIAWAVDEGIELSDEGEI
jgi:ribosome biogenesis GTPase A